MVEPENLPCANRACSCDVPAGGKYCCGECAKAGECGPLDLPMARCACGHPECEGWARATGAG